MKLYHPDYVDNNAFASIRTGLEKEITYGMDHIS